MASCPAYAGPICSLCCSLDARCHDLCKPHARIGAQVSETLGKMLPQPIYARINSQFGHYLGVFAVSAGLVGLTLGLIYLQTSATAQLDTQLLSDVLWKVFFALTIIIGVVAWLFVLAQQSRRAAEAETRRQTTLLIQEIDAHKRTDAELQRAKEVAESANLAKSRYVVGLSHELRSPLNAISRLRAIAGTGCQPADQTARPGARRPPQRRSSLRPDRRHSGYFQDRGRPALSVARRGSRSAISSTSSSACSACRPPPRASISSSSGRPCCRSWSMPTKSGCGRF